MKENIGNYRWRIVAFLITATTINYIDRQILGILAPVLQKELNWTEKDYSYIVMAFQGAYALGLISMGRLLDRIGSRLGYIMAMFVWSCAAVLHAFGRGIISFSVFRFLLGIGQATNFPAAIKTIAEWFPKHERALATGWFNMGSNVGAILTPLIVPFIALQWNWQMAFIVTGLLGFIWLLFWWLYYKTPDKSRKLTAEEKNYITKEEPVSIEKIPWKMIILHKQTLGICLSRFLTDPIWWFFLFWLPKFLKNKYDIDLVNIGLPLIIIYLFSMLGSYTGGWISSFLIRKGKNPVKSRKTAIFIMALLVLPIFLASITNNLWLTVGLISLATFAHQGYAANIFTIVSDIYPKNAIGSMVGLSGFAGAIGGFIFAPIVGLILEHTGNYYIIFAIAGLAYILCWLSLKIFVSDKKVNIL